MFAALPEYIQVRSIPLTTDIRETGWCTHRPGRKYSTPNCHPYTHVDAPRNLIRRSRKYSRPTCRDSIPKSLIRSADKLKSRVAKTRSHVRAVITDRTAPRARPNHRALVIRAICVIRKTATVTQYPTGALLARASSVNAIFSASDS